MIYKLKLGGRAEMGFLTQTDSSGSALYLAVQWTTTTYSTGSYSKLAPLLRAAPYRVWFYNMLLWFWVAQCFRRHVEKILLAARG